MTKKIKINKDRDYFDKDEVEVVVENTITPEPVVNSVTYSVAQLKQFIENCDTQKDLAIQRYDAEKAEWKSILDSVKLDVEKVKIKKSEIIKPV